MHGALEYSHCGVVELSRWSSDAVPTSKEGERKGGWKGGKEGGEADRQTER